MYYYVFEQPKTAADRKLQTKVREQLEDLGIVGELTAASPARSAEELTDMGLRKGASTIIAVGSDRHINHVASMVKTTERGLNRNVVVGTIPLDTGSALGERLRLNNLYDACEALKKRRYTTVDLGYVEGGGYFITSAEIHTATPVEITLRGDRWEVNNYITDLIVFSDLTFSFYNNLASKTGLKKIASWLLGGEANAQNISIFRARTLQVTGSVILPLTIEGEVVAKTPIILYRMPKALKIIIKRDKFISEQTDKKEQE